MKDIKSSHWGVGCYIICWRYNSQVHHELGNKTTYQFLIGQVPRVGISNLLISPALLDTLHTEAELNEVLCIPVVGTLEEATLQ